MRNITRREKSEIPCAGFARFQACGVAGAEFGTPGVPLVEAGGLAAEELSGRVGEGDVDFALDVEQADKTDDELRIRRSAALERIDPFHHRKLRNPVDVRLSELLDVPAILHDKRRLF